MMVQSPKPSDTYEKLFTVNVLWRVGASRVGGWLSCSRGRVVFSVGVVNGRFLFRVGCEPDRFS